MTVLKTEQLSKSYGKVSVLHGINIDIQEHDFLVLVGPSGCGKSTLLNCIAGLEHITTGKIHIGGRDVTQEPPKNRDIAMVFQSYALYPTMNVANNIAFGLKVRGVPKAERDAEVARVADILQIQPLLDRKPSQLSGGQRQRVAMGRALVRQPTLFLFDEPLSNLDAKLRVDMRAEIKALHSTSGKTFVYVTHDQIEAMTLGTKIAVLNGGNIQQLADPDTLYHSPSNQFVAGFMGSPPMQFCKAVAAKDGIVSIDGINGKCHVALPHYAKQNLTGDVTLGVRPEHWQLDEHGPITLAVSAIEKTGAEVYANLQGQHGTRLLGRFAVPVNIAVGDVLTFSIKPDAAMLFDAHTELRIGPEEKT